MIVDASRRIWSGVLAGVAIALASVPAAVAAPAPTDPLAAARVAHHPCDTILKGTPTCVVELSARLQRAFGNSHPASRVWVRTTAVRAGIVATTAPVAQRRRTVLVAELRGPFPADGSSVSTTVGNVQAIRFVVNPANRRMLATTLTTAGRPAPKPFSALGGRARSF